MQLPAYSPLSGRDLLRGLASLALGRDEREQLADLLAERFHGDRVVLTDSGTAALQLAIRAVLDHGAGEELALPAFSCFDLVTAAVGVGASVRFYDVDPTSLAPSLPSLERAVARPGVAAVVSPLFGVPVPWDDVRAVAAAGGAHLIEDAAQGFGASWRGRPLGSFGDCSVLSFGRGKGWTGGGGGAVIFRNGGTPGAPPRLRGRSPTNGGILLRAGVQWAFGRPSLYGLPARIPSLRLGETVYSAPVEPSAAARVSASLLLSSLADAEREVEHRRRVARRLLRILEERGAAPAWVDPSPGASFLRLPLVLPSGLASFEDPGTARRLGILPGYPELLPRLMSRVTGTPVAGSVDDWPGADELVRNLVTLPTHSRVSRGAVDRIEEMLARV